MKPGPRHPVASWFLVRFWGGEVSYACWDHFCATYDLRLEARCGGDVMLGLLCERIVNGRGEIG